MCFIDDFNDVEGPAFLKHHSAYDTSINVPAVSKISPSVSGNDSPMVISPGIVFIPILSFNFKHPSYNLSVRTKS